MKLTRQGLSSRLRRRAIAKQWCFINERRMNWPRKSGQHWQPQPDERRRDHTVAAEPLGAGHREQVASSALTSVSNEPRRHFRVLLDRTESPGASGMPGGHIGL